MNKSEVQSSSYTLEPELWEGNAQMWMHLDVARDEQNPAIIPEGTLEVIRLLEDDAPLKQAYMELLDDVGDQSPEVSESPEQHNDDDLRGLLATAHSLQDVPRDRHFDCIVSKDPLVTKRFHDLAMKDADVTMNHIVRQKAGHDARLSLDALKRSFSARLPWNRKR